MNKKRFYTALTIIVAMTMVLSACQPRQPADTGPAINTAVAGTMAAQNTAQPPTGNPTGTGTVPPPAMPAKSDPTACQDGKPLPNIIANTPDIPWGSKDGGVIAQVAWKPGTGHGGWNRVVAIAEKLSDNRMPYANEVQAINVTQYCGTLDAMKAEANSHVTALATSGGANENEIPVVFLHTDGTLEIVKPATNGPSLDQIKAHLEMRAADPNNLGVSDPSSWSGIGAADTSSYEGTATCQDGFVLPEVKRFTTEAPFGRHDGAVIAQITWKSGPGFAGWGRFIAVVERMQGQQAFAINVDTIHAILYCGALKDILKEAENHVTALVNSSQEIGGQRPNQDEIPIVFFKNDGTIEIVKAGPNGPSLAEIQAHLEMRP